MNDNTIRTIAHDACTGGVSVAADFCLLPSSFEPTRPLRARRPFCPPRRLAV